MPSAVTGSGCRVSTVRAYSVTAVATTGQDRSRSRPAWVTVRPPSATAAPAAARNRPVTRRPGGTWGTDSVNDERGQSGWAHRQRRLCHTNRTGTGQGTSRGPVLTHSLTELEPTPHDGHRRARSSAVTRWITRHPSDPSSTRWTTT